MTDLLDKFKVWTPIHRKATMVLVTELVILILVLFFVLS